MDRNPTIVIPIWSDQYRHHLHCNNNLSLLYVKELNQDSQMLMFDHHDTIDRDTFDLLENKIILTTSKKQLLSVYPSSDIYDINLLKWFINNKTVRQQRNKAIEAVSNRYYEQFNLNRIIPVYKHQEYCDQISIEIEQIWSNRNKIEWESYYNYNKDAILAFYSIERNGIKVSSNVTSILGSKVKNHLSQDKLYSDYFLYTSTGRPSNSFGGVNFAALDSTKRIVIIPDNDLFVEFDYDGFHLRLLSQLVDYNFSKKSVHGQLDTLYGNIGYEESKAQTFRYLYGGIPDSLVRTNPFFAKVSMLTERLWDEFQQKGYIRTPLYKRKLLSACLTDIDKQKLLNYWIQAYETEHNIQRIITIHKYLYKKKTKLSLYNYDSFLFDYDRADGNILFKLRDILEQNNYPTRIKVGTNFGQLENYEI